VKIASKFYYQQPQNKLSYGASAMLHAQVIPRDYISLFHDNAAIPAVCK
jgi:hypothetical protein